MAEFRISKFRYTWEGNWSTSTLYLRDDVIFYEGSTWVCIRQHTSTNFNDDLNFSFPGETILSPAWVKMVEGKAWKYNWTPSTSYERNNLVVAGGNLYIASIAHISATNFSDDILKWDLLAAGYNFRDEWLPSVRYLVGDVIRYNGYTYQCILEHESSIIEEGVVVGDNDSINDSTSETWSILVENYTFVGEYQQSTIYRKNDLVKYGGSILKCTEEHLSPSEEGVILNENFSIYLAGYSYTNDWSAASYYAAGDVVRLGGTLYTATANNYNSQPGFNQNFQSGNPIWTIINKGIRFRGTYNPTSVDYKQGDIVRIGGSLWLRSEDQIFTDSTLVFLDDTSGWELVISGQNFRSQWTVDQFYDFGDVVYFRGSAYYAQTPHLSDLSNFPGNTGIFSNLWTILISGDQQAALVALGDVLSFNVKRLNFDNDSVLIDTDSTIGTTNIPIGTKDQLLVVNDNNGNIGYKTWGTLERVFFVSLEGIDDDEDLDRGSNYFKPYRTVKFALEKADDNFSGTTTIKINGGEFQEILPLIVPSRTAVVGTELRSTTIRPNEPIKSLVDEANFTLSSLVYLGTIIPDLLQGLIISKTDGNTSLQIIGPSVTLSDTAIFNSIWSTIIAMIDFRINDSGTNPLVTGSNNLTIDQNRLDMISVLENNREFIKEEAIAWLSENYPQYSFDIGRYRRDLDRFINSVQYDLQFPGNYKSILSARYYANAVTGSKLEDMFYVRDTTGVRNMTLRGLSGELPPLTEGSVYRIPTGGSFVSLDPGWGPDDQRVWIINRSCYVQNVTTFGVGAVGQKIDGLLHNGGNKSIVSNDFTQVISDGIGAWVQNGGRAELVSVFTYYAHIGMFAKDGGIIRATNGNSSYGDFGAVADGIDPDEEVRVATVNTRTKQAIVAAAFAGEVLDFILALEFDNCGQNYTTADYNIRSSGTGAVAIQEEIRDDSMFICQVLSQGSGFRQFGNQAQLGDELTITLATAETVTQNQILGMRIIITSGEGTGQYGFVQSYDPVTKVCTVYRESDNQPGWDNILPGIPPRQLLTSGTRYRIEPRVTFSDPPYLSEEYFLSSSSSWSAAVYGETSGTFTIVGNPGTGTTIDIPAAPAQFTVIKTARRYTVTLTNAGAGYFPNDTIILDGGLLEGQSLENDILIRVLSISDDSTNSIVTWEIQNDPIAASGRFVLTPSSSQTLISSPDGVFWDEYTLPNVGDWKCLAWGNNRFVTIRNNSNNAAYSNDGKIWISSSMPAIRNWNAVAYGKPSNNSNGVYVAVAGNLNAGAFSVNGISWTSFTMPTFGDSTLNEWVGIAFGYNRFVAVANSGNVAAVGTWNGTTLTWQPVFIDNTIDPKDWISVAYGNRRFVVISSTGEVAYSFDGLVWELATMPTADGSTIHNWKQIRYGQGVFFAIGDTGGRVVGSDPTTGPTRFAATSYDGIVWAGRELASEEDWNAIAFGNPDITLGDSTVSNSRPTWIVAPGTTSDKVNRIFTGAKAQGRVVLSGAGISSVKIWEPGSGYVIDPTLILTDPSKIDDIQVRTRTADGVLAQPTFISQGTAYKTSTTFVTVSGDGFADITPVGNFITFDNLEVLPSPGAQFYIGGRTNFYTATVVGIDQFVLSNGKFRSTFRVSPRLTLEDFIEDNQEVLIREKYSQVRITGHDFLDVGTGNFEETNYPKLYIDYDFTTQSFQETQNLNGGRVFFTSTDQDGNFRAGTQFVVQQATGILTISADFFDLSGLTEIRLAGINVGSTAVIREFSKDPLFLQNSNNVIPTQRAIIAYLQSRLNVGGEDLLTPSFIAGTVRVGPNLISSTAGLTINFPVIADFYGSNAGISGSIIAQTMFFRSFSK
jgi:hypothetical protein